MLLRARRPEWPTHTYHKPLREILAMFLKVESPTTASSEWETLYYMWSQQVTAAAVAAESAVTNNEEKLLPKQRIHHHNVHAP